MAPSTPPIGGIAQLAVGKHRKSLNLSRAASTYDPMNVQDPIKPAIRQRIASLEKTHQDFLEEDKKRKRDISDSSVESICDRYVKQKQSKISPDALDKLYMEKIQSRISARIRLTESHLGYRNLELQHLLDARKSGALKYPEFAQSRDLLEGQIRHMRLELIGLKRQEGVLRGKLWDSRHFIQEQNDVDVAVDQLMDNIIRTYSITPAAPTSYPEYHKPQNKRDGHQSQFRQALIKFYNAPDPDNATVSVPDDYCYWCPISHQYFRSQSITAAHIVPFAIGETNCNYLFPDDDMSPTGHLMHPGNGLLMHSSLEQAMDKARIAIVPADEMNPSARDLKVVVFDRTIIKSRDSGLGIPWAKLDGLRLEFKNDNRPRLRYLYLTFLMSLFRRRRFECTGWRSDLARYASGKMWASPGNWVRGSSIRVIARRVAYETHLEAFVGTHDLPLQPRTIDERDDEVMADEVMESYEAKVLGSLKEQEVNDEED
ncbi:uncharacterized protein K441DRAFT_668351 [Cenococcum geophilum 1.58]|uniref:uncharacterized protein n=1 Tax=Cenococcum geophilum 1.58 TaxID=794803 RepID=UPI00358E3DD9|nr:hypothetical protein K441DRAFT_668351 [Cenococcum geophilum 1.58]